MKGYAELILIFTTSNNGIVSWLKQHLLTCPFKATTGMDCPGCGIQRSVIELFQGNLTASFVYFPATIPIIMLIFFTIFHLKFDLKEGAFVIKMFYIAITLIIVINYCYKIYTKQLF